MKNEGCIYVSVDVRETPIWNLDREYSKLQAWMDIVIESGLHDKPIEVDIKGRKIICDKNECIKSISDWSKRWNWTKVRVQRFINKLSEEGMIETTNEVVATKIRVRCPDEKK